MTLLRVEIRSPGRATADGAEVELLPAQWRVLAELALQPEGVTPDDLRMGTGVGSAGSLRTLITGIRRQLERLGLDGATLLRFAGGRYRLMSVTTDMGEELVRRSFVATLVPDWDAVLEVLRPHAGTLVKPVVLEELDEYDAERLAQWERARIESLRLLAEAELRRGTTRAAAALLDGDDVDIDEQLAVLAAVADYRSGRQRDSLRRLSRLRRALLEDLGQPPSQAALSLEHAILRQDLGLAGWPDEREPAVSPPLPLPIASAAQRPLRGRDHELAQLDELAASAPPPRLAVVAGPNGIGKSALISTWATALHGRGAAVVWADASDAREYAVIEQFLHALEGPDQVAARTQLEASEMIRNALRAHDTVVLVIDNAGHLAVNEARVLNLVMASPSVRTALIVVAEIHDGIAAAGGLAELYTQCAARGTAVDVQLGPLDVRAVGDVLRDANPGLDAHHARARARELLEWSGGNPLWVLIAGTATDRVPAVDPWDQVLRQLPARSRGVLEYAALLGPTLRVDELLLVPQVDLPQVSEAIADATRHELVVDLGPRNLRFANGHVRSRIIDLMGPTREAALHAELSVLLRDRDPSRSVLHAVEASPLSGDVAPVEASTELIRSLVAAGQTKLASTLAAAAVRALDRAAVVPDAVAVSVLAAAASAFEHEGHQVRARALADRAWEVASRCGGEQQVIAALALGAAGESIAADPEHLGRLATALAACREPASWTSLALRLAQGLLNAGDLAGARPLLDDAVSQGEATYGHLLLERHLRDEDPDLVERLRLSAAAAELSRSAGDIAAQAVAAAYRSVDLFAAGRIDDAHESWEDEDRIALESPTPKERWFAAARRCFLAQITDDQQRAEEQALAAFDIGVEFGYVDAIAAYSVQLFLIRVRHGGLAELEPLVAMESEKPGAPPAWTIGLACATYASGDIDRAARVLVDGLQRLAAGPSRYAVAGWYLAGRLLGELPDPPAEALQLVRSRLEPWSGSVAVVGTSVGYVGVVDAVLAEIAGRQGDSTAARYSRRARALSQRIGDAQPSGRLA